MDASTPVLSKRRFDAAPVRVSGRRRNGRYFLVCDAGEGVEEVDCVATLEFISTSEYPLNGGRKYMMLSA
jgi:hypothetical protein